MVGGGGICRFKTGIPGGLGGVWGGGVPSPPGDPPPIFFSDLILNRPILVQTECFLYSSPEANIYAVLGIGEGENAKH